MGRTSHGPHNHQGPGVTEVKTRRPSGTCIVPQSEYYLHVTSFFFLIILLDNVENSSWTVGPETSGTEETGSEGVVRKF